MDLEEALDTTSYSLSDKLQSRFQEYILMWRVFKKDYLSFISLIVIIIIILAVIFAPAITPYSDQGKGRPDLSSRLNAPSKEHPLGTDDLGRDLFARILYGGRPSLSLGFLVVMIACVIGIPLGAIAGYYGGLVGQLIMRVTDMFLSFPALLLAITISAALGPSFTNAMIAIALTWWPQYTRLVRAQTISVKELTFVEAAKASGVSDLSIIRQHILPNVITVSIIQATMDMGSAVLMGSALSFIGLGIQPPKADWGNMLTSARTYFSNAPWFALYPGIALLLVALSFNLLGDGLRDILDPQSRRQR